MAVIVGADDDANVRLVITRVLEQAGHTLRDGAAAVTDPGPAP